MDNIDLALAAMDPNNYIPINEPKNHKLLFENNIEQLIIFIDEIRRLSMNAKEIVEIVFNPPETLSKTVAMKNSKKLTLDKISDYLINEDPEKWTQSKINKAFKEIKEMLRNF